MNDYYSVIELEIKKQEKDLKYNDYYVLKKHPELAYLYSDKLIYQRIIALRDKLDQLTSTYLKSQKANLIKTIDELSLLNNELKRRNIEESNLDNKNLA